MTIRHKLIAGYASMALIVATVGTLSVLVNQRIHRDVRSITEYSYKRGEATFVEFLDAQRAFNETMQGYNEARAELARSLYLMDSISGKGINP